MRVPPCPYIVCSTILSASSANHGYLVLLFRSLLVAYLFSDNKYLAFKVAKYAGTDKCDLIESSEYGFGCLLQTADRIIDRLHVENRTWTRITSKYRLERHMFEPVPVREVVINMLVHNDYTHGYTPVVEIFSDRLELTSHGGLPEGLSEDMFFKGVSRPRNKEIMRIFHEMWTWLSSLDLE